MIEFDQMRCPDATDEPLEECMIVKGYVVPPEAIDRLFNVVPFADRARRGGPDPAPATELREAV